MAALQSARWLLLRLYPRTDAAGADASSGAAWAPPPHVYRCNAQHKSCKGVNSILQISRWSDVTALHCGCYSVVNKCLTKFPWVFLQFQLITILVFDQHQNGIPVAFFICQRATTRIIKDCLSALLEAARKLQPDFCFRSVGCDDADEEINAIR